MHLVVPSVMKRTASHLAAFGLFVVLPSAGADSWKAPTERMLRSPDGRLELVLTPGTCKERPRGFQVPHQGSHASARLKLAAGAEVVYELGHPTAPVQVVFLDSGDLIALDQWFTAGYGRVLERYDASGKLRWSKTLEELLGSVVGRVPTSTSSRHWLKHPLTLTSEGMGTAEAVLVIGLWNEDRLRVDFAGGAATYEEVEDHGDDAEAWMRKGQGLVRGMGFSWTEDVDEAIACFERAVEIDPHLVPAWKELGKARNARHDRDGAIAAFREGVARNPFDADEDLSSFGDHAQTDPRMHLRLDLARALERAGRREEAVATLEACLEIDLAFWGATRYLAVLHHRAGRGAERDALLGSAFDILARRGRGGVSDYRVSRAAYEVGGIYKELQLWEQAKQFYERGFRKSASYLEYLHRNYAKVLEELGEHATAADALREVHAQLETSLARAGGDDHRRFLEQRLAELNEWIAGLKESAEEG
ncbi:MAG: tetratricopeptide repeat protein [Planctomycetota bacterium]|nr:tetratricopeptide repeat protein [Planctomycetota bacterium]